MDVDIGGVLTILVALLAASLIEHKVIAPRMAHSPGKTTPASTAIAQTSKDYIDIHYPGAVSVS